MDKVTAAITKLDCLPDNECSCDDCKKMCSHVPCWGTPDEIMGLLELGYGDKMMLDYYEKEFIRIDIVCPATIMACGKVASWNRYGDCVMLNSDGLCTIHSVGKPIEGRVASCERGSTHNVRRSLATLWDTDHGKTVVELWEEIYLKQD